MADYQMLVYSFIEYRIIYYTKIVLEYLEDYCKPDEKTNSLKCKFLQYDKQDLKTFICYNRFSFLPA